MYELKKFVQLGKKIVGAGLNYKSIVSSRNLPMPKTPIIFLKPTSSYITEGQCIEIPKGFDVHHEIELGVIIGKAGTNLSPNEVKDYIGGYCLALDLTAVDQLSLARSQGMPWTLGKGFDTACPVSGAVPAGNITEPDNIRIWCSVNGEMKQDSSTCDMIFPSFELISYISKYMVLEPYDLILTGSPTGVGPIKCGDTIKGGLGDILTVEFTVKDKSY